MSVCTCIHMCVCVFWYMCVCVLVYVCVCFGICVYWNVCMCIGGQMAERLGNRAINQKVVDSIPGCAKMGKALHPTCLGWECPLLTVSRSG